jgi:hypothetical protein
MKASVAAVTENVYWALDGGIHHKKCSQRMVLTARDSRELHLSCPTCTESVRLPLAAVTHVAVAT